MPHDTPQQSVTAIREALIDVEDLIKALKKAADVLHDTLGEGFSRHGHLLVPPDEIAPLAGGGTEKPPERP